MKIVEAKSPVVDGALILAVEKYFKFEWKTRTEKKFIDLLFRACSRESECLPDNGVLAGGPPSHNITAEGAATVSAKSFRMLNF